jgi:transposase InsO family protein
MKVSRNAYYTWCRTSSIKKQKVSLLYLKMRIKKLFHQNKQIYGSLRIQKALEKETLYYSRSYIAILMKELGLKSILSKKFRISTTDSNHYFPIADNVLNRNFTSLQIGEKWVSDITYIKVANQWNYVTTILDLADRKIVAWVLSDDMTTENTVYKVWMLARKHRNITNNHIFHSDRGVQYASNKMSNILKLSTKITQSMSRKGNCWDNAVAESFFKTLKYECTNRYNFKSYIQAYQIIEQYMNWYNNTRMHSTLGYKSPAEFELELKIKNNQKVA